MWSHSLGLKEIEVEQMRIRQQANDEKILICLDCFFFLSDFYANLNSEWDSKATWDIEIPRLLLTTDMDGI